jgi:phage shock protein A
MSNEIFDTNIIKKQIKILEQRLKTIADSQKVEQENKVLQNQVKQLRETGLALKKRIGELSKQVASMEDTNDSNKLIYETTPTNKLNEMKLIKEI